MRVSVCACVCVCVCVRARLLRIVSTDKILRFTYTSVIIIINPTLDTNHVQASVLRSKPKPCLPQSGPYNLSVWPQCSTVLTCGRHNDLGLIRVNALALLTTTNSSAHQ